MNPDKARMVALQSALKTRYPAREVTRDLVSVDQIKAEHLAAGTYTITSNGADRFTNVPGYNARDGKQKIFIFFDFKLGERARPSEIEDREFESLAEISAFLNHLPESVCQLELDEFHQSGQVYHPHGWCVYILTYQP